VQLVELSAQLVQILISHTHSFHRPLRIESTVISSESANLQKMSIEKLEEIYHILEDYDKLNNDLCFKIARAKEEKSKEERLQYMLKLELSQMRSNTELAKREVARLESEEECLSRILHQSISLTKRLRNTCVINDMRMEIKEHSMEKLRYKLDTLDFAIEEEQNATRQI